MIEIVNNKKHISTHDLWILCNEMNWFTGGTNSQYEKLFDLNREDAPLEELALVIWICTPDSTREGVLEVLNNKFGGTEERR